MERAITTALVTPIMSGPSEESELVLTIPEGEHVDVLDRSNKLWWRVRYESLEGYINTLYLKGENFNGDNYDIMICIPKENAEALYKALKFALKR